MKRLIIPILTIFALTAIAIAFSSLSVPAKAAQTKPAVSQPIPKDESCCDKVDKGSKMAVASTGDSCCKQVKESCEKQDCEKTTTAAASQF